MQEEKTFNVNEIAEMFYVNKETVRRWIRNKKIAATKKSDGLFGVTADELIRFVEKNQKFDTVVMRSALAQFNNQETIFEDWKNKVKNSDDKKVILIEEKKKLGNQLYGIEMEIARLEKIAAKCKEQLKLINNEFHGGNNESDL